MVDISQYKERICKNGKTYLLCILIQVLQVMPYLLFYVLCLGGNHRECFTLHSVSLVVSSICLSPTLLILCIVDKKFLSYFSVWWKQLCWLKNLEPNKIKLQHFDRISPEKCCGRVQSWQLFKTIYPCRNSAVPFQCRRSRLYSFDGNLRQEEERREDGENEETINKSHL